MNATSSNNASREEIAKAEIGRTDVSRPVAGVLAAAFLLALAAVPAGQHAREIRAHRQGARTEALPQCYDVFGIAARAVRQWPELAGSFFWRMAQTNAGLLREIHAYEDGLENNSWFGQFVLPRAQEFLIRRFGVGNEKVYLGRAGWLFYRPEIDHLTGPAFLDSRRIHRRAAAGSEWEAPPHPDPVAAIVRFRRQLAERGIELVVVPAPAKPAIHPENFSLAYSGREGALRNPSDADFAARLRAAGVLVFDATEKLARARRGSGRPQYLSTDTHWRPEAMELVAQTLAEFLRKDIGLPETPPTGHVRHPVEIGGTGDLARMLRLPPATKLFPPETATIQEVRTADGSPWQSAADADVLVLGDSFCNVFSLESMGWGASAGLVEQLSFYLQRPVDRIVRNDAGAFATRQMLAQEMARGRDRLAGKRVVVWEFAARELSAGDWKPLDLVLAEPSPERFLSPERGRTEKWIGTIAAIAPAPEPGRVPYKDHVVAVHLVDVATESDPVSGGEALVYAWSLLDNVRQPAAFWRPGQQVRLRVQAWTDVADRYDAINRAELDDDRLMLEKPCWGEVEEP